MSHCELFVFGYVSSYQSGGATNTFGGGFFNMDSLQQQEEQQQQQQQQKGNQKHASVQEPTPVFTSSSSSSSVYKPLAALTQSQSPAPKPPANIKGKLMIPKASKATTPSKTANAVSSQNRTGMFDTPLPPSKPAEQPSRTGSEFGAFQPVPQSPEAETETEPHKSEVASPEPVVEPDQKQPPMTSEQPPPATKEAKEEEANNKHVKEHDSVPQPTEEPLISLQEPSSSLPSEEEVPTADLLSADAPSSAPMDAKTKPEIDTTAVGQFETEKVSSNVIPETASTATINAVTSLYQQQQEPQEDGPLSSSTTQQQAAAVDELTSAGVAENVLEQFSSQLKRLEDNHQMERQALHEQHQQELQALTSHLQKLKQELDQVRGERNRQKESYTLQLDSLKHELEGTQQLLQGKGKDERKLQDQHLKQLRTMEKEMNQKEKANEKWKQELKDKEVRYILWRRGLKWLRYLALKS